MTDEHTAAGDDNSPDTAAMPTVLIVDDSRVMRVSLARLLGRTCQVIETENGQLGLQALEANPAIDLVFSDLSMPVMDGFELLRQVRSHADPAISSVPFVVITGHEDDEGMQTRAAELGASDFVSKPFRSTEITTRASTLIEKRREMRALRQELGEQVGTDALTGLANTAAFMARFEQMVSLASRHGLATACLVVQLDGVEAPAAGQPDEPADGLLRTVAELLGELVRVEDATGYLGDGRFGLALSGADRAGAQALARRLGVELAARPTGEQTLPDLRIGISTPDPDRPASAAELLEAARTGMEPLPMAAAREPATLAGADTASELLELQQELEQTRDSLLLAEQAEQNRSEQLRALQEGAREQLAKAHQTINGLRNQLSALQTKFRDYTERYSQEAQQQADTEIAQLRATLEERDAQLAAEERLRSDTQQMLELLQARQAEAEQAAEESKARGSLWSRLFGRGGKD